MATPDDASAIAQVRTGIEELRAARLHMRIPYFLALLADAHRRAGDEAGALAAVEEAFAHVSVTGERRWEPELHRLRGEMPLLALVHQTPNRRSRCWKARTARKKSIRRKAGQLTSEK